MKKFDDLARLLRVRVESSAGRERSLDWKAADAIQQLQARIEALEAENGRLDSENRMMHEKNRVPVTEAKLRNCTKMQTDVAAAQRESQAPPSTIASALGLREAAELLRVSYGTVYAHRLELGFFQVGSVWRVWPERLKECTEPKSDAQSTEAVERDCGTRARERSGTAATFGTSLSARQAEIELDKLLAQTIPRRRKRVTTD